MADLSDEQSPHTTKSHDEVSNTLRGRGHDEKSSGVQAPAHHSDHNGADYQKHITEASTNWLEAGGNTPDILKSPAQLYQEWFMAGLYDAQQSSQPTASRDIMTMGWLNYMHSVMNHQSPLVQGISKYGKRAGDYGLGALWTLDTAGSVFLASAAASTGVGIPLAAALGGHAIYALDHAQAAFREGYTGHAVDTYGVKGLTALTGSHQLAEGIDLGVMIASSAPGLFKLGAKGVSLFASRSIEDAALTDQVLSSATHGGYNEVVTASKASSVLHAESSASRGGLFGTERYTFKPGEDLIHFEKHGVRIANKVGPSSGYTMEQYVADANRVINQGTYIPELNGYVSMPTGLGDAEAPFVGVDRATKQITTFHLKSVKTLEKRAPSLGWFAQPKSEMTDIVGPNREFGWRAPYRSPY